MPEGSCCLKQPSFAKASEGIICGAERGTASGAGLP
jgi:hypothetical protein